MDATYLDPQVLIDEGYLQEVNRRFFHPLGLALEVRINEETPEQVATKIHERYLAVGAISSGCDDILKAAIVDAISSATTLRVQDHRDDLEGVIFADPPDPEKALNIQAQRAARDPRRLHALGYVVQPVEAA